MWQDHEIMILKLYIWVYLQFGIPLSSDLDVFTTVLLVWKTKLYANKIHLNFYKYFQENPTVTYAAYKMVCPVMLFFSVHNKNLSQEVVIQTDICN